MKTTNPNQTEEVEVIVESDEIYNNPENVAIRKAKFDSLFNNDDDLSALDKLFS